PIGKGLDAHGYPRDSRVAPGSGERRRDVVGVRFQCDLRPGKDRKRAAETVEQGRDVGGGQERGSSATEIERIEALSMGLGRYESDFAQERREICRPRRVVRRHDEGAVAAARTAIRKVGVDARRLAHPSSRKAASASRATSSTKGNT